jgi:hypothetical protein
LQTQQCTHHPQVFAFHHSVLVFDHHPVQEKAWSWTYGIVCASAALVAFPQLLHPLPACFELQTMLQDVNGNTAILPMCLMLNWLWQTWRKWTLDGLTLVFCLSAIICIESFCSISREHVSYSFGHFLRSFQKNCFSVTLVLLWAQSRVHLEMVSFRGIGRQIYSIKKTLTNSVVLAYFLFIFVM